ncbi:MAG TPA: hypothetical protein GX009_03090 [Candidatus Atribacteria bacterium]|jgi:hypothetical protein|nr:hypothetical protein [Candidatus Atribacteria bacterium]
MAINRIFNKADLPLEVSILLIAGLMMLITGILLFPVSTGALPYYENGLYGLLLFIFALQIVTLGKTPFGDMSRSKPLIVIGVIIAAIGIVVCFIPNLLSQIPRILLFICFAPGGFLLLLQMFLSQEKLRTWVKYGGIFKHLIVGCGAVYVLSILIGLLILMQSLLTTMMTAAVGLIFGIAIIYLALVLRKIYLTYPEAENTNPGTVELSTDKMMLLMTGVFMLLLGILLIPVNLGQLPFSGSAQLGLLMVIFSIQMLASGSTPIGSFPRSWLMILFGLLFAALGIISSIIPGVLVKPLTLLIGILNILGGCITLVKILLPRLKKPQKSGGQVPPILQKLFVTQFIMGFLSILFGSSMLVSHLLPGLIVGVVLFANGCILLYLMSILLTLDKMISQKTEMRDPSS